MNTKNLNIKNRRKFSLLILVTTIFMVAFIMVQLMFAPSMVQPVYAGSTLTPTSVPVDTPVPADTPAPTSTKVPSNNNNNSPDPTATPIPEIPDEIPALGVGATWQPLLLMLAILVIALSIAVMQVRYLLSARGTSDE
jgi:uncharacterized membrane protein YhaH (DUF805 family)